MSLPRRSVSVALSSKKRASSITPLRSSSSPMLPASAGGDLDRDSSLLLALVAQRLERRVDHVQRGADEQQPEQRDEAPEPAARLRRAGRKHRAAGLADPLRPRGTAHRGPLGDGGAALRGQRPQLGLGVGLRLEARLVVLAALARGAPGRSLLGRPPTLIWCPPAH